MSSPFAVHVAVPLIGLLLFLAWVHPATLDPTNVGWLLDGSDRGQNMIGLAAYLRLPPDWPSLRGQLLSAPDRLPLLFTDSNPLLGLLLRPFASLLPPGIQLIGWWVLVCAVLQAVFAWMLVRSQVRSDAAALAGTALLTAMPVLINRFLHTNLCAQWLILWALWLFLDRRRSRGIAGWLAVVSVAALVHNYLLLLVLAIWGSAVLRALAEPERGLTRWRTLARAALVLGVTVLLVSGHGVLGERYASTRSYGWFSLALDAWVNPADPNATALMPSSPDVSSRGFEGFNYLGAGLLLLCVTAVVARWQRLSPAVSGGSLATLRWLVPAYAVLTLVAFGSHWRLGPWMVHPFDFPEPVLTLLDPVRASGRLFWPVTYTVALAAILLTARFRHATAILWAALAVQLVDIAPLLRSVRATSAAANEAIVFHRTVDPRWQGWVARAAGVTFRPTPLGDFSLLEEIEYRAILACRPTNYAYAARQSATSLARFEQEGAALAAGLIDPRRLYVFSDVMPPPAVAGRVIVVDNIRIIPPSAPSPPPRCRE